MIEANICYYRHHRLNKICRVKPTTHPNFQHREIHLCSRKVEIRDHSFQLKLSDRPHISSSKVIRNRLNFADQIGKIFLGYQTSIYLNALTQVVDIWRKIQSGSISSFSKIEETNVAVEPLPLVPPTWITRSVR